VPRLRCRHRSAAAHPDHVANPYSGQLDVGATSISAMVASSRRPAPAALSILPPRDRPNARPPQLHRPQKIWRYTLTVSGTGVGTITTTATATPPPAILDHSIQWSKSRAALPVQSLPSPSSPRSRRIQERRPGCHRELHRQQGAVPIRLPWSPAPMFGEVPLCSFHHRSHLTLTVSSAGLRT